MKKLYCKPAVQTDSVLEQTSLACNITAPAGPGALQDDDHMCTSHISKNNSFSGGFQCDWVVADTCNPAIVGVVLS